ncbi:PEGA domain-containing protein [Pendulispora rubella]|uniref:PEGA domain-containing protein n=1 Tax=Pendulispora rubella TaxID=2741070 RepID=A0ABZ2L4T3_9BACT
MQALALALLVFAQIPSGEGIVRARGLDQQGVRAFREGRFRDAIRFFTAARRLGGPSSEIWNIARCHQRLDEPEDAARALEGYLEQTDLMPSERAEATRELNELRRRPSQMAIDSDPAGASVTVDGKPAGSPTPVGLDVAPGPHRVRVEHPGHRVYEADVEARYGRAILVSAKLVSATSPAASEDAPPADVPSTMATHGLARRFLFSVEVGAFLPRLGDLDGHVRPGGALEARYVFNPASRVLVTGGLRFVALTYGGSKPSALCQQADDASSVELGGLATGAFAVRALPRLRVGAGVGLGVAGLVADASGPDASKASCAGSYGLTVLGRAAIEGSLSLTPGWRLLVSPLVFEAHPAWKGARENPPSTVDAGGLWWRLGATLGFAFDAK